MAERRRGRGKKSGVGLLATEGGENDLKDANEDANDEWSKVVEKKSYNPDKVRSKQVEIAKVRVKVNEAKEELETAVTASDFIKAQEMKEKIVELTLEQSTLEKELKVIREGDSSPVVDTIEENSNSRDSVVPLITKFPALFENVEEPEEQFSHDDTDDEFAPPGAPKKKKKRKATVVKKVKRLKKSKPKAPSFLPESIVGKYSVLIHREDPDYETEAKESGADQADDLTKIDDCDENPNFALVVDFLARFGDMVGLRDIATKDFQLMLCAQVAHKLKFAFFFFNTFSF